MIPVSDTSEQHIKRVVRVRKQRQELFGWRLSPVDKFLHVIAVDEVTPDYNPTAAYRAGFKFGDRITHVNGQPVSYKTDIYQLMIDLKDSVEVCPLFPQNSRRSRPPIRL
jgi:membrane-associated protease RseP (regulator of RpoE activity)